MIKTVKAGWIRTLLLLIAITIGALIVSGYVTRLPDEELSANGMARNQAFYVPMRDGVRIAVDLWFPPGMDESDKLPALLHMTRYWRATETGFLKRALIGLRLMDTESILPPLVDTLNQAGYAVMLVDARGSGASFGHRVSELAPDEIEDYGELVDWITAQDWSNKRVGAFGVSYDGITAERLAGTGRSAVKAVVPLYADFDFQLGVMQPGGAKLDFVQLWSDMVEGLDSNDICAANGLNNFRCWIARTLSPGVKPVNADNSRTLLGQAIADHKKNLRLSQAFEHVEFRDDSYGTTAFTIADLNTYSHQSDIENSDIPMQIWLGWLDAATVNGGLSRFLTFSNRQDVIIGPFSHGGAHDTNPFNPIDTAVSPGLPEQHKHIIRFLDRFLKSADKQARHQITYYTMGADRWCQTPAWPPANMHQQTYFFADNGTLSTDLSKVVQGTREYQVDISHSTGSNNRWFTNLDYGDVFYAGRDEQDAKLLTYTSTPLKQDMIITGSALVTFYIVSSHADVVFHVYLESIDTAGNVYHLAEGTLRSVNHRLTTGNAPSEVLSPPRSFERGDARPLVPGERTEIVLALTPTSVQIPAGQRLRLAFAGADASIFPLPAKDDTPQWTVHHGAASPSRLLLPLEGPDTCHTVTPFRADVVQ